MNKKIDDIKFGGTNDEMVLEDFVLRSEPKAMNETNILQRTYAKISMERRHLHKRRLLRVAAVVVPLLLCAFWSGLVGTHTKIRAASGYYSPHHTANCCWTQRYDACNLARW